MPKEVRSSDLRFGEKHRLEIRSVEQRREFRVENAKAAGPTVKISRASIESWGLSSRAKAQNERRVVDLHFSNVSRPELATKRFFAVFDPRKEELNLRIRKPGGRAGDVIRLEEKKEYTIEAFLQDFTKRRIDALSNVTLRTQNERLEIKVDGRIFPLSRPRLDARGLKAILSARIGREGVPIRFTFDGEKARMTLFDDCPVICLREENGLAIRYDRGGGASRTFRLLDRFTRELLDNRVRLVAVPETEHGTFSLIADTWLGAHVRDRFARCSGYVFLSQKGDVSEEICRYALTLTSFWREIADHPYNTSTAGGSRRTGPDSLQRLSSSGELFYFEFKWWSGQQASSDGEARRQAEHYLKRFPTYQGEKIEGVFIGLLDWNVKSDKLEFHVERAI